MMSLRIKNIFPWIKIEAKYILQRLNYELENI